MVPAPVVGKIGQIRWKSNRTYTWCIERYIFREENYESLWSPVFEVRNYNHITKWQIKIQSKSVSVKLEDFISIYIYNRNNFSVKAQIQLCFLDNKGTFVKLDTLDVHLYQPGMGFGFPSYVKHSWITDDNNGILSDGKLRIRCEIVQRDSDEIIGDDQFNRSILSEDFKELLEKNKFSDVTLKTKDGKSFRLHKCILASRSSVFQAMFKSKMRESCQNEVHVIDFSYEVMSQLCRYAYTGRTSQMGNLAIDLLRAADKYDMKGLMDLCEKSLCNQITFTNVLDYLELADMYNKLLLKEKTIEYLALHIHEIADMPDLEGFITLYPALTCQIFSAIKSKCYWLTFKYKPS